MAKTRIPIISEDEKTMQEAGLQPITFKTGDYEPQRDKIRSGRSTLIGVQQIYIGEPRTLEFPPTNVHWLNHYNQRKASGHAVEYRVNPQTEFKPGALIDVTTLVQSNLVPIAG